VHEIPDLGGEPGGLVTQDPVDPVLGGLDGLAGAFEAADSGDGGVPAAGGFGGDDVGGGLPFVCDGVPGPGPCGDQLARLGVDGVAGGGAELAGNPQRLRSDAHGAGGVPCPAGAGGGCGAGGGAPMMSAGSKP
jgi:hypothetical protein